MSGPLDDQDPLAHGPAAATNVSERKIDRGDTIPMISPDGLRVDVPVEHARAAFLEQGYGVPKDEPVRISLGDETGHVDPEHLHEALTGGADIITRAEYKAGKQEDVGTIEAGLRGAARGFAGSFGAPDPLAAIAGHLGLNDTSLQLGEHGDELTQEERTEAARALHPIASGAGELAGMLVGSAVAPGGGAISGAGNLAERGIAGALGAGGKGLMARAGASALRLGARGAAEGGILAAIDEENEAALGDHELNAEKVFTHIGKGALYGGIGGAILGPAGELAGAGARKVFGHIPKVGELAEEQAFRSLNPIKKFAAAADKIPGGTRAVGRELLDRGLVKAGDTIDEIAPRIAAARSEVGAKIDTALAELDAKAPEAVRPNAARVANRVEREVIAPLEKLPGYESITDGVRRYIASFAEKVGLGTGERATVGFQELADMRRGLDDLVFRGSATATPSPIVKELRSVRAIVEDELEQGVARAGKSAGEPWIENYKGLKDSYRKLAIADDAASSAIAAREANRAISPTDYLAGIGGAAAGAVHGGPVGLMGGLALGAAHHVIRERGNATAAVLLDKIASLGSVRRAAQIVDEDVERSIDRALKPKSNVRARLPAGREDPQKRFDRRAAEVRAVAQSPELGAERLGRHVGDLGPHAPMTAGAVAATSTRAAAFLASKLPTREGIMPGRPDPHLSDMERAKWNRYADAVEDPLGVLDDMSKGRVSRESVEALKTVYPKLYAEVRQKVLMRLAEIPEGKKPPYESRIRLGLLFDLPLDRTLEPRFIADIQKGYATGAHQKATGAGPKPAPAGATKAGAQAAEALRGPFEGAQAGR